MDEPPVLRIVMHAHRPAHDKDQAVRSVTRQWLACKDAAHFKGDSQLAENIGDERRALKRDVLKAERLHATSPLIEMTCSVTSILFFDLSSARFSTALMPPQQGTSMRTTVTERMEWDWKTAASFST